MNKPTLQFCGHTYVLGVLSTHARVCPEITVSLKEIFDCPGVPNDRSDSSTPEHPLYSEGAPPADGLIIFHKVCGSLMILHGRNVVEDKIKAGATEIRGYLVNKHVLRKADAAPAGQANNLIESNQFAEAGERLQNHFSSRPAPRGERGENRGFSAPYQDRNAPMRRGYGNR